MSGEVTTNITTSTADHDLLIELRTEMKGMRNDIKDLKDGTTSRISALEHDKEDKVEIKKIIDQKDKDNADYERRIRRLEWAFAISVGAFAAVEFYFKYLHK